MNLIRFFGSHQSVNGYGAGNDAGIYLSQPIESGGFRTMYLDFATNHLVPLCTRPECTHVDESCTAYCNTSGGGLSLAVTDDALIRCYLGGSSLETARIVRSDLNGENPEQIAELPSSQRLGTWIAGDNHFVYAIRTTVNPDTTLVQDLIRIDVQTGEVSQIVSLESTSCFLVGARDRQIIVKCFLSAPPTDSSLYDPDASQVFIAINADTGEQTTLASLPIAQNAAYYDGSNAQLWVLQQDLWGNYRIYSNLAYSVGNGYTINRHSVNSSCIMWSDSSSSSSTDAAVEIYTIDSVYRRIALVSGTNNYLTCEGNPEVNGVNLVWSTYANAGLFRETSP